MLDEESSKLVIINTHKGLFQYARLPLGVASVPAVFRCTMKAILLGIPQVICYLDDILITDESDAEHMANLETVLKWLKEHGVRLNKEKCQFFWGHHGISGTSGGCKRNEATKKLKAVLEALKPRNVQELHSFLDLINSYGKLPLTWPPCCICFMHSSRRSAMEMVAGMQSGIPGCQEQAHRGSSVSACWFQTSTEVGWICSSYGIRTVLSHILPDGSEHLVALASHACPDSKWAQLLPLRERSSVSHFWSTQVSSIPVRSTFHLHHGP